MRELTIADIIDRTTRVHFECSQCGKKADYSYHEKEVLNDRWHEDEEGDDVCFACVQKETPRDERLAALVKLATGFAYEGAAIVLLMQAAAAIQLQLLTDEDKDTFLKTAAEQYELIRINASKLAWLAKEYYEGDER